MVGRGRNINFLDTRTNGARLKGETIASLRRQRLFRISDNGAAQFRSRVVPFLLSYPRTYSALKRSFIFFSGSRVNQYAGWQFHFNENPSSILLSVAAIGQTARRRRRRRLENTETREARIIACWHLRKLSIGARGKRARVLKNNAATVTNNFYTDVPIEIQIPASRSVFQPALSKPLRRGDNSRVRRNEATLHARIYRRAKHLFRRLENVFTTNTRYGTRRASQTRRNVSLVSKTRGENPTTKSVNFSTFYYNHKNHV